MLLTLKDLLFIQVINLSSFDSMLLFLPDFSFGLAVGFRIIDPKFLLVLLNKTHDYFHLSLLFTLHHNNCDPFPWLILLVKQGLLSQVF